MRLSRPTPLSFCDAISLRVTPGAIAVGPGQFQVKKKQVAVLGAGAIGVSVASYLLRDGHDVTLIDRGEPGMGCSYGNAGLIQCSSVVPVAMPGVVMNVPKMLLSRKQPLFIRWRSLPSLMPYLLRFLWESRPARAEINSKALAQIIPDALDGYKPLIEWAGIGRMVSSKGELHVYEIDSTFQAAKAASQMRLRRGVPVHRLTADEVYEMEPELARIFKHGIFLPNSHQTVNPGRFVGAIAQKFAAEGGRIVKAEVTDLQPEPCGKVTISTSSEKLSADTMVLAFGAFSGPWAKRLGVDVPLNSERGYHMMLNDPGISLNRVVISGDYKFVMAPIDDGIRLTGIAELAKVGAAPDHKLATRLLPKALRILPRLRNEPGDVWMGHRPSLPNSVPVIGAVPQFPNVVFAFGHAHSGLTLGGMTGRLVSELISEKPHSVDFAPFSVERFASKTARAA